MFTVCVVMVVRDDAEGLVDAVNAVLGQRGVEIGEVAIAVGPSSDRTALVADEFSASHSFVVVVENPSGRTPDGLNAAIAATTGEVVVRVDARAVLPPYYVSNALESLELTGAGNVGAIQRPVGHTVTQRGIAAAMLSPLGTGGAAYRGGRKLARVDTAWLGVFRRDALETVGGFDPEFTRNQDAELNLRLADAGYEVWLDPRLVVDYQPRSSLMGLARQYWQYGWWRVRNLRKHPRSMRLRQVIPPVAIVAILASVIGATVNPATLVLVAGYALVVLGAGLSGPGQSLAERLISAAALMTMHFAWGLGFMASAASSLFRR